MTLINIQTDNGNMHGYLAKPQNSARRGIVVLQEIFGVNQVMRDICDDLATQGFYALCPDLFWRIEPDIDITDQTKQEWDKAFQLFEQFNVQTALPDIAAAIKYLRQLAPKIGAIGFCLGGQLAYLTAAQTDIDAAVGFYGVNIQNQLGEADNIKNPLMLHIAEEDQFVPKPAQAQIAQALGNHPQITLHHYPKRDHAFARKGGEHYHEADAKRAWQRSLDFLSLYLN